MEADKDGDGKLSFEEFASMVANTVGIFCRISGDYVLTFFLQDIVKQMTLEDLF
jgi:serine/threonine-protein phosphatase 2B regulatory subunit